MALPKVVPRPKYPGRGRPRPHGLANRTYAPASTNGEERAGRPRSGLPTTSRILIGILAAPNEDCDDALATEHLEIVASDPA